MISAEQAPREVSMLQLIPKSSVGGASIATIGAINHNDFVAIAGLAITVLTFMVNLYYKRQQNQREANLNAAQIASIKKE